MYLYLIEMTAYDGSEAFYKIGQTGNADIILRYTTHGGEADSIDTSQLSKREKLATAILGDKYRPKYRIEIKHAVKFANDRDAAIVEAEIIRAVAPNRHEPKISFGGRSECFTSTDAQLQFVIAYMNDHANSEVHRPLRTRS
jgi:hypothetical protein